MDAVLKFRGRLVTTADVAALRALIAAHPQSSRRALSTLVCERWNWRQANTTDRYAHASDHALTTLVEATGALLEKRMRAPKDEKGLKARLRVRPMRKGFPPEGAAV
jgi:hypothetical protein